MKSVKILLVCVFVVLVSSCASKGSNDLKSPCVCGESTTHRG